MSDKQRYSWITATALASILSASAYANEPPSLLQIMQQLGRDLNQISDGMLSEDYAAIAKAAQAIAEHPQPPVAERTKIIGGLGADAGRFRQGDQAGLALVLEAVALSLDGDDDGLRSMSHAQVRPHQPAGILRAVCHLQ